MEEPFEGRKEENPPEEGEGVGSWGGGLTWAVEPMPGPPWSHRVRGARLGFCLASKNQKKMFCS